MNKSLHGYINHNNDDEVEREMISLMYNMIVEYYIEQVDQAVQSRQFKKEDKKVWLF